MSNLTSIPKSAHSFSRHRLIPTPIHHPLQNPKSHKFYSQFCNKRLLRCFTIEAMVTFAAATKTTSTIPTRAPAQCRVSHFVAITCSDPDDSCDFYNSNCRSYAQLVSPSRDPISYFDSNNVYLSLRGKPLDLVDPSGFCAVNWPGGPCTLGKYLDWCIKELNELSTWLPKVKPCPCALGCRMNFHVYTSSRCGPDSWEQKCREYKICPTAPPGFMYIKPADLFGYHPGTMFELRENTCDNGGKSCNPGSQCTYGSDGKLLTTAPGAGSADLYSGGCGTFWNSYHRQGDVGPHECASELDKLYGLKMLDKYHEVRPVNSGKKCEPMPVGCTFVAEHEIPRNDFSPL